MAEQRFIQVVIPVIPLTVVPKPAVPTSATSPPLRPPWPPNSTTPVTVHYYECCACEGLTKHLCKSDWKTAPVLLSADPAKVPRGPHRVLEFNFTGYLKGKKELCDLYMTAGNQSIRCRICDIDVFTIVNPSKAPHLTNLIKHVTCKKHLKKIQARLLGKLTPAGREKEPAAKSCLCHICNKFVRPRQLTRHNVSSIHKKKLAENSLIEDLTDLIPGEAHKKVQKAFFDALEASGTSKEKIKFFQPFLEKFCPGGGSVNKKNLSYKAKAPKKDGEESAASDDNEEDMEE